MSDTLDPQLEARLAALTTWPGESPGLWRRAGQVAAPGHASRYWGSVKRVMSSRVLHWAVASAAVIGICVGIGSQLGQPLARARKLGTPEYADSRLRAVA
jgi:hypothetical protein